VDDNDAWHEVEGFHLSLEERWTEFDNRGRRFFDLLDSNELDEAIRSDEPLGEKVNAFCLLSSMQEAKDMAYWVQINRTSDYAALLLAEFLLNAPPDHGRPRFRAARALELFEREIRDAALSAAGDAVSAAKEAGDPAGVPVNSDLIEAARKGTVEEYTRSTPYVKSEESRGLLLTEFRQFPRHGKVRLI